MAGNTSAIIVVMVAVCMVAVTVPAVIVASEDDEPSITIKMDLKTGLSEEQMAIIAEKMGDEERPFTYNVSTQTLKSKLYTEWMDVAIEDFCGSAAEIINEYLEKFLMDKGGFTDQIPKTAETLKDYSHFTFSNKKG